MNNCDCSKIKIYFSNCPETNLNESRAHKRFPGAIKYPEHFGSFIFDYLKPKEGDSIFYYQCAMCNQFWYIELNSEEQPWPEFGIKLESSEKKLTKEEIEKYHHDELAKTHDGYGEKICNWPKCNKKVLLNRRRCEIHLRKTLYDFKKNKY